MPEGQGRIGPRRGAWPLVATAFAAAALAGLAARWAFFDQSQGTPAQVTLQVLLPVPIAMGLAVCGWRARGDRAFWGPAAAFLAAAPALLVAWSKPRPNPGDEHCSARGFLPHSLMDDLGGYTGFVMPLLGLALFAFGLVLLAWPRHRPVGAWLAVAGVTHLGAAMASWTCIGT